MSNGNLYTFASHIYFRMQLSCCFIVLASSVIFCGITSITAAKVNITALNESVWEQWAPIKEDLDIQDSYPCPAMCLCSHLRNPSRVQVLCQPYRINMDLTLLNRTSFLSELYIICGREMNITSSTLHDGIFETLHAFFKIVIRDCYLTFVSRYAFRGLNSLTNLEIVGGQNTNFDHDCFQLPELSNLQTVTLVENNISSVPSLCNLHKLRIVNLTKNNINCFSDSGLICERPSLIEIISISDNSIEDLPIKFKEITSNLQRLYASRNRIDDISATIFETLTTLELLDLTENNLVSFPNDFLGNNTRIDTLHLSHNRVRALPKCIFSMLENLSSLNLNAMDLNDGIWYELRNLTCLQNLYLSDNNVQSLDKTTLLRQHNLKVLDVSENNISAIPNGTFVSQSDLLLLNLSRNNIIMIEKNSFAGLQNLETLDLQSNQIMTMHEKVFIQLVNLKHLILSFNYLTFEQLPDFPPSLFDLNLSNNNITMLFDTAFCGLSNLFRLNLESNNMTGIQTNTFVTNTNLQVLKLAYNKQDYLSHLSFPNNSKVQRIELQNNIIDLPDFPNDFFPFLTFLNLSHNKLKFIYNGLGTVFPESIQEISLAGNDIEDIESFTFHRPNLKDIDLRMNKLKYLQPQALSVSRNDMRTVYFHLSGNPFYCDCHLAWLKQALMLQGSKSFEQYDIVDTVTCQSVHRHDSGPMEDIPLTNFLCQYTTACFSPCHCCNANTCPCRFYCPVNCTCYHGSSFVHVNVIDCLGARLTSVPADISDTCTVLDLSGNILSSVTPADFRGLSSLKELYLNSSYISEIVSETFKPLLNLTLLNLGNNFLRNITLEMFEGLYNLEVLTLSFNQINKIENGAFDPIQQLNFLDIRGNKLKTFSNYLLTAMSNIFSLQFSKNPLSCYCKDLTDLKQFIITNAKHILDLEDVICEMYDTTTNDTDTYQLANVNLTDLCLNETNTESRVFDKATIVAMSTTLIVFALGLASFGIIFWNREFLKVWCFVKFGWKVCREPNETDANRPYDAFVCYNSEDERFVIRELVPHLEGTWNGRQGYKLCLHFRDFPIGAPVAESIVAAIENSKRVIIVLSENFLNSEWCHYEFQTAHYKLLQERKNRIIVILLHEINNELHDNQLRIYLKTHTYVKYGDPWFWSKLEYAMPDSKPAVELNAGGISGAVNLHTGDRLIELIEY